MTYKQANRRYLVLFIPTMLAYVALCLFAPTVSDWLGAQSDLALAALAVLSAAPIAVVFLLLGRLLRETDEYTRKIHVDAALSAGATTLLAAMVWGFLELYGVDPHLEFPSLILIVPVFFFGYGLSIGIQSLMRS